MIARARIAWRSFVRAAGFLRDARLRAANRTTQPRFLTHTVTFGCNARCMMCDSWKLPTAGDLTTEEIASIYKGLPTMDVVRLTGGEPFARRDMVDINNLALRHLRPLVVHVTTNGFLTDRIVEFCEQRDASVPLLMMISIDGVGEKHNEIRGHSKAYDFAIRTIEELAPRRAELGLSLSVNQTIVDAEGAAQYPQLRDILAKHSVHNQIVMAYDTSATYNLERDLNVAPEEIGQFSTFGTFTDNDLRTLLDTVENDLTNLPMADRMAKRYYIDGIRKRLLGDKQTAITPPCVAVHQHLRLFPNGDVPTCQFNTEVIGNLRDLSFAELWKSERADEQRAWVRACPGCWAECEVLPSAIYTLDILGTKQSCGRTTRSAAGAPAGL